MEIEIQNHKIGDGHPVFFIAEAGVNHNGSLELAFQLVDKAFESGADAVKFQTFKAEKLNTKQAPKSSYHIKTNLFTRRLWRIKYDCIKSPFNLTVLI